MKKTVLFIFSFLFLTSLMWGQIISQYIETNSGTFPKGIEIWNSTGSTLDFSVNNLVIEKGVNGAAPSTDYTLSSGTLAVGDVIVIGTSDMEATTVANGSVFYLKAFTFNGDDALVVKYGGTTTDVFGEPGTGDPGAGWSGNGVQTYNQNIKLKAGITTGDVVGWTDPSIRFEIVSTDPFGDGPIGFGIAPILSGNLPPQIANVTQTPPIVITSSTTVSVSADVTDSDGTISLVELHWGLTSGSLGTTISMSNGGSGDTYTTSTDIPAQSDGTTVYYEVYAVDNNTNPTTSSEFNYFVSDAVSPTAGDLFITEICGDGADGLNNDNGFMEIYNTTSNTLSLANVQARYFNSNPDVPSFTLDLSGTIAAGAYIIITQDETAFNTTYTPTTADFYHASFWFNGGVDGVDIYLTTARAEVLDEFNDNGVTGTPFTWNDDNVFERTSTGDGGLLGSWTEITTGIGTPGADNENPLPVTLTDFSTAIIMNEFVQISWTTQSESSINVWNLYRGTDDSMGQILINSQPGTNTSQPNTYIFDDFEVEENITYYYYLEVTEYDGTSNMWGPISAMLEGSSMPELPTASMLECNYPNPFNPSTTIKCDIKEGEEGVLTIYNFRGQLIEKQILNAGEHTFEWDGTAYGSGVYLYKLETDSYTETKKMIMLK